MTRDPSGYPDGPNPYVYCRSNPVNHIDPLGLYIESAWDIASLAVGVSSFVSNVRAGNVRDAVMDGVGVALDAVAVALPIVPGGAGMALKAARVADKIKDTVTSSKTAAKVIDKGKNIVNKAGDKLKETAEKVVEKVKGKNKGTVQNGEFGTFGDLQKRSVKGDNLDIHEYPSHKSQVVAKESELGMELTVLVRLKVRN